MGFDFRIAGCYAWGMTAFRSHRQIILDAANGTTEVALAERIGDVKPHNVRDWRLRDSIPSERWLRLVELQITTYEELAAHAAQAATEKAA